MAVAFLSEISKKSSITFQCVVPAGGAGRIFVFGGRGRKISYIIKGEQRPEISLLHMKVLTLIKAKSNVFP